MCKSRTAKAAVRCSVLVAGLAVLALGAPSVPARADAPGSPGKHNLMVKVPGSVRSLVVDLTYTPDSSRCYDNVTPGTWNDLKRLVPNKAWVEAWGFSVSCADRDPSKQVAYGSKQVPSDSSENFWLDTMR